MRRTAFLFFVANVLLFSLLRIVFFFAFRGAATPVLFHELAFAFYLGLKFDARFAAIVAFPLLFIRRGAMAYVIGVEVFALVLYAADFGTYAYIGERLNASVITLLRNPLISLHMVWESYHVVLFAATILAIVSGIAIAVRRTARASKAEAGASWAIAVLLVACMYGKFSRYPLRWSDAYFSRNDFACALALNPAQYLFDTMREKPQALDLACLRRFYPALARYLGVEHPDAQTFAFTRTPPVHPMTTGTPNVVLIQLESFAAFKTGILGNTAGGSPDIDQIARNGILFTNHYSPSQKTARALFAVLFGIPDVSSWQASANNPLTVAQKSIANDFIDYDRLYFLGGSANWSNIRGMLEHNLRDLRVFEEGDYDAPQVDAWGVSDEVLFIKANDVLRSETRPFFAIIQTSGNHRPYNMPDKTHGFTSARKDEGWLRARGFGSNEEFNAFRYLDHSVGLFFEHARREAYFANTVFVLYGDHGVRTGASADELAMGDLSDVLYHVPWIIYAPDFVRPGRVDTPTSHVDILPTVASICGRPYVNRTLGVDVLDAAFSGTSMAFYFTTFRDPPDLALVQSDGLTTSHAVTSQPNLANGFYEASRWLLVHNHG